MQRKEAIERRSKSSVAVSRLDMPIFLTGYHSLRAFVSLLIARWNTHTPLNLSRTNVEIFYSFPLYFTPFARHTVLTVILDANSAQYGKIMVKFCTIVQTRLDSRNVSTLMRNFGSLLNTLQRDFSDFSKSSPCVFGDSVNSINWSLTKLLDSRLNTAMKNEARF